MRLVSKIYLLLAAVLWAVGYTPFGSRTLHGVPEPLGVIFFGLFLITWVLPRRDFEQFEEDQTLRRRLMHEEKKKRWRRGRERIRAHFRLREAHH
jgi:hypothetical protein